MPASSRSIHNARGTVTVIRWLLTIPSAALGWMAMFAAGFSMLALLQRLCPPELVVSGMCTAAWYRSAETAAFALSAALGAALFVALPSLVAPAHRARVAGVAWLLGCVYTTWLAVAVGASVALPAAAAVGSGLLVALRFARASRRPG